MSTLGDKVRSAREAKGWDQSRLALEVGYSQPSISDIENGTTSSPRSWRKVAAALDISEDEFRQLMVEATRESAAATAAAGKTTKIPAVVREALASGRYAPDSFSRIANSDGTFDETTRPTPNATMGGLAPEIPRQKLPGYGLAAGGDDGRFLFNGEVVGWELCPPQLEGVSGAYFVYVNGVSMEPRYRPGEIVWMHPHRPPRRGDDVVVQLHSEEEGGVPSGYIKEFVGWAGNDLLLHQHNPAGDLKFPRDQVLSIHPIVFAQRS